MSVPFSAPAACGGSDATGWTCFNAAKQRTCDYSTREDVRTGNAKACYDLQPIVVKKTAVSDMTLEDALRLFVKMQSENTSEPSNSANSNSQPVENVIVENNI